MCDTFLSKCEMPYFVGNFPHCLGPKKKVTPWLSLVENSITTDSLILFDSYLQFFDNRLINFVEIFLPVLFLQVNLPAERAGAFHLLQLCEEVCCVAFGALFKRCVTAAGSTSETQR